jgi:hypothetical protein
VPGDNPGALVVELRGFLGEHLGRPPR